MSLIIFFYNSSKTFNSLITIYYNGGYIYFKQILVLLFIQFIKFIKFIKFIQFIKLML